MPDIWMDVDVTLAEVPVNLLPLLDDTDFKAIEAAVAYNAAGMALYWHFVTPGGAYTVTAVTPTSGGDYDWTDQGDAGIYTIEIPASGGASINNDTEGFGWFTGKATGVLPWRGPVIGFRAAALNNALIDGGDTLDVNVTEISGDSTAAAFNLSSRRTVYVRATYASASDHGLCGSESNGRRRDIRGAIGVHEGPRTRCCRGVRQRTAQHGCIVGGRRTGQSKMHGT